MSTNCNIRINGLNKQATIKANQLDSRERPLVYLTLSQTPPHGWSDLFRGVLAGARGTSNWVTTRVEGSHLLISCQPDDTEIQSAVDFLKPMLEATNRAYEKALADKFAADQKELADAAAHNQKLNQIGANIKF